MDSRRLLCEISGTRFCVCSGAIRAIPSGLGIRDYYIFYLGETKQCNIDEHRVFKD